MNKKTIAIIGSLTVVLGVFCPLFTVPIIGSVSYAGQMQGEGLLLAACAIASLLFALNNVHALYFPQKNGHGNLVNCYGFWSDQNAALRSRS